MRVSKFRIDKLNLTSCTYLHQSIENSLIVKRLVFLNNFKEIIVWFSHSMEAARKPRFFRFIGINMI